jgi:ribose transport system substrate-binding protein
MVKSNHVGRPAAIETPNRGVSRRVFLDGLGAGLLSVAAGATEFLIGSASANAAEKSLTVAVLAQQMAAQSDQRTWAGMQDWLKKTGMDAKWRVNLSDAKGDPGTLVSRIQDAITAKVDAIVVLFGTLTAARSALESLKKSNVPFISVDSGWQAPAIADLATNNYLMGAAFSQYMVDRLLGEGKSKANICAVIANFHHGTRKRGKVMKAMLTENEWINLLAERVIQYEGFYETTQNAVNDWLTRHGSDLDAIWCPWDEPAMAAAEVIKSRKLQDKIFVVGADGHPTAIERMHDPAWPQKATCAQAFELWGAYTGWLINEIVGKGRNAKEVVPVPNVWFPAPLLVQGVNLPEQGKLPWESTDLYYLSQERVIASMRS